MKVNWTIMNRLKDPNTVIHSVCRITWLPSMHYCCLKWFQFQEFCSSSCRLFWNLCLLWKMSDGYWYCIFLYGICCRYNVANFYLFGWEELFWYGVLQFFFFILGECPSLALSSSNFSCQPQHFNSLLSSNYPVCLNLLTVLWICLQCATVRSWNLHQNLSLNFPAEQFPHLGVTWTLLLWSCISHVEFWHTK
jgi:hypothetical protein